MKIVTPLRFNSILLFLVLFAPSKAAYSQTILFQEDFSGANQGWTLGQNGDCDGSGFIGVANGEFEVTDMEGVTCCPGTTGAAGGNFFLVNPINIQGYCAVTISIDFGCTGNMECSPTGPHPVNGCNFGYPVSQIEEEDYLSFAYGSQPLSGLVWASFCGNGTGPTTLTLSPIPAWLGNMLNLTINVRDNEADETWWLDNIAVIGYHAPTMDPVSNITVCAGEPVVVDFTGQDAQLFNWTNDNPAIGLAASGSSRLDFVTPADLLTQQVAHIKVKPVSICEGAAQMFTITVNPLPIIHPLSDTTVCIGQHVSIPLAANGLNPVITWSNSDPAIGLAAGGSGNIDFTAAPVANPETGVITVSATAAGCPGPASTFTINVEAAPTLTPVPAVAVCAGAPVNVIFDPSSGATVIWTNSKPSIGLPAAGTGNLDFTAAAVFTQQVALVTATPISAIGCKGRPVPFPITVSPLPILVASGTAVGCDTLPDLVKAVPALGTVHYSWTGPGAFTASGPSVAVLLPGIYTVTATNALSGCSQTDTALVTICCSAYAGVLDTTALTICGPSPAVLNYSGNPVFGPNDSLRFILFTDSLQPLSSIVAWSATPVFPFQPGLTLVDSVYYVAAVVGQMVTGATDTVNLASPCLDLSRPARVRWRSRPTMSLVNAPSAVCRGDCLEVTFAFTGTPPFLFTWALSQAGQTVLYETVSSAVPNLVLVRCAADFSTPLVGGNLSARVISFYDGHCGCSE